LSLVVGFIVAFLVTVAVLIGLLRLKTGVPMDTPNHRSLHHRPIPRIGGLGMISGLIAGSVASQAVDPLLLGSVLILAFMSFFDDSRGLPVVVRFGAHLLVACLWVVLGNGDDGWVVMLLAMLTIGWMINLYNFMDGSDGLAGGMALMGFGAYGIAAWWSGQSELLLVSLAISGAAAGFLAFNFHPARVFLGDAGSIPLGFLAAALGLAGWRSGAWPLWFPVLVFSPFVVDATTTLLRRALRGERVWQAHREHYYQRMVRMGWGHRRTALVEYGLMLSVGISGLAVLRLPAAIQLALLVFWVAVYLLVMYWIDSGWRRFSESSAQ
jgi:UDP-N-acetylmuramyl pentapeptide phosphotransferase/UDP-N-acetylglucosamine-1-phosphate transferase